MVNYTAIRPKFIGIGQVNILGTKAAVRKLFLPLPGLKLGSCALNPTHLSNPLRPSSELKNYSLP